MTEKEKMLAGEWYLAADKQLSAERMHARKLLKKLNDSEPEDIEIRVGIVRQLLGRAGKNAYISRI